MSQLDALVQGSRDQSWTTPRHLFDRLNREFQFTLDAAADPENALCEQFLTTDDDALSREWTGVVFCNPPFRAADAFVRHAATQAASGATVVMLMPVRTDTNWWHDVVIPHAEIRWIRGRVNYGGAGSSAPFASCVLVFRPPFRRPDADQLTFFGTWAPGGVNP